MLCNPMESHSIPRIEESIKQVPQKASNHPGCTPQPTTPNQASSQDDLVAARMISSWLPPSSWLRPKYEKCETVDEY